MKWFIEVLSSGEFWTAVGSIAALGGLFLAWWHMRRGADTGTTGRDIDELPDEKAFVDSQAAALDSAKIAVALCLHTVHHSDANWKARRINASLVAARRRGLTVRVLAGTGQEQLLGAYELQETHQIDVRLSPELLHSDLRFLKVDAVETLLGIANTTPDRSGYSPSHSWATLTTTALADALEREFQRLWISPSTKDLHEYCADYVAPLRDRISAAKLASDLGLRDAAFISQFYHRVTLAEAMANRSFVFHGKSASGKSMLMRDLARRSWARRLDLEDFVLPLVFRHGNENVVGERIRQMYDDVIDHAAEVPYDLIETGSDFVDSVLPALFQSVRRHGRTPVLVHCEAPLDAALRRNAERVRPVPVEVLQSQSEEEERGTFKTICAAAGVQIIELPAESTARAAEHFVAAVQIQASHSGLGEGAQSNPPLQPTSGAGASS